MRLVIKFAGALLEDRATVQSLAEQVASLAKQGHEILVVHCNAWASKVNLSLDFA
jgi:acetylglutamate kinase